MSQISCLLAIYEANSNMNQYISANILNQLKITYLTPILVARLCVHLQTIVINLKQPGKISAIQHADSATFQLYHTQIFCFVKENRNILKFDVLGGRGFLNKTEKRDIENHHQTCAVYVIESW